MAGNIKVAPVAFGRVLTKQKESIIRELNINQAMSVLWGMFSRSEELEITSPPDQKARCEVFVDILARKSLECFQEFCGYLERNSPHLLTKLLIESSDTAIEGADQSTGVPALSLPPTQSLQLSLELALKERDSVLREKAKALEERDEAVRQWQSARGQWDAREAALSAELDAAKHSAAATFALSQQSALAHRENGLDERSGPGWPPDKLGILETETVDVGSEKVTVETHRIVLHKPANCGFGIAVSGGRDNPHFANGDPAIAVSDVIKGGPAEGKLNKHDRVLSVNGFSLDNVDHSYAIKVLKDGGSVADVVIRRHVVVSSSPAAMLPTSDAAQPCKVTLTKKSKRDELGISLGFKLYVKDVQAGSLAALSNAVKEEDVILKINGISTDTLSLSDARKLLDKVSRAGAGEKFTLLLKPAVSAALPRCASSSSLHKRQNSDLEYQRAFGAAFKTDNVCAQNYTASVAAQQKPDYEKPSIKAYTAAGSTGRRQPGETIHQHQRTHSYDAFLSQQHAPTSENMANDYQEGNFAQRPLHHQMSLLGHSKAAHMRPSVDGLLGQTGNSTMPRRDNYSGGDIRYISFKKEDALGVRIAGGNATGIFIAAVLEGSTAHAEGLREGDEIVEVDGKPLRGLTREEAVVALMSTTERIDIVVQHRGSEYERLLATGGGAIAGDLFYVCTHFAYDGGGVGHLAFGVGDVFRITDTLVNGVVGEWAAVRIDNGQGQLEAIESSVVSGIIPNATTAEQLASTSTGSGATLGSPNERDSTKSSGIGNFFRRRSSRRTKSLSKDHWDDVIFVDADESNSSTKFPAYERVVLQKPAFIRPVVIFGGLADVARDKLCREQPERFESPQPLAVTRGNSSSNAGEGSTSATGAARSGIIHLATIRSVMARFKHCVLDVTPDAVDRLNYAQYAPIVVLLHADSKTAVKELRERWAQGSRKSARKLHEHATRVERTCAHLLSAVVTLRSGDNGAWFQELQSIVAHEQQQPVWMSDVVSGGGGSSQVAAPSDGGGDDILFPMSNRLSYAASPESELDLTRCSIYYEDSQGIDSTGAEGGGRIARSSSDPNLGHMSMSESIAIGGDLSGHPEDKYYPSYYAREDPATVGSNEAIQFDERQPYTQHQHMPLQISWAAEAAGGRGQLEGMSVPNPHGSLDRDALRPAPLDTPAVRQHQRGRPGAGGAASFSFDHAAATDRSKQQHRSMTLEVGRGSSDNYSSYDSYGNKHDDSKLRDKFGDGSAVGGAPPGVPSDQQVTPIRSDPYRFTRLTTSSSLYSRPSPAKPVVVHPYTAALSDGSASGAGDEEDHRRMSTPYATSYDVPPLGRNAQSARGGRNIDSSVPDEEKLNRASADARFASPVSRTAGSAQRSTSMNTSPSAYRSRAAAMPVHASGSQQRGPAYSTSSAPPHASANGNYGPGNGMLHSTAVPVRAAGAGVKGGGGVNAGAPSPGSSSPAGSFSNKLYMDHREAMQSSASAASTSSRAMAFESYQKLVTPGRYGADKSQFDVQKFDGSGRPENISGSAFESYRKPGDSMPPSQRGAPPVTSLRMENNDSEDSGSQRTVASASGLFDESGGLLESKESGVSIYIPPGALPAGVRQEVYFRVCEQDRTLLTPLHKRGETILSPLVMCGPEGLVFLKPVELRLPHAAAGSLDNWSLSLNASGVGGGHSGIGGDSDWRAVTVDGRAPQVGGGGPSVTALSSNSKGNIVAVLVDHF